MKKSAFFLVGAAAFLCSLFSACAPLSDSRSNVSLDLSAWINAGSRTLLPSPANAVESIEISISGPGMATIQASYPPTATMVKLSVPAGPSRTISLSATLLPGTLSAINKLTAQAVTDLVPGPNQVILTTGFETKIIVPDYMYSFGTGAIRQFDTIAGDNPKINTTAGIRAYDIDFDANGRVFLAGSDSFNSIFSVANIDPGTAPTALSTFATGPENTISIAIDRKNNFLYHVTRSSANPYILYKMVLNATDSVSDLVLGIPGTVVPSAGSTGLAVDDSGMLYLLGSNGGQPSIMKLDPRTPTATLLATQTLASFSALNGLTAFDVMTKDGKVYVTAYKDFPPTGAIVELSDSLAHLRTYGTSIPMPMRFVAILNKKFYIADEVDTADFSLDRIVSFDDFDDLSLEVLAPGTFGLYLSC